MVSLEKSADEQGISLREVLTEFDKDIDEHTTSGSTQSRF